MVIVMFMSSSLGAIHGFHVLMFFFGLVVIMMLMNSSIGVIDALLMLMVLFLVGHDHDD
jgi:hypothetical protein